MKEDQSALQDSIDQTTKILLDGLSCDRLEQILYNQLAIMEAIHAIADQTGVELPL